MVHSTPSIIVATALVCAVFVAPGCDSPKDNAASKDKAAAKDAKPADAAPKAKADAKPTDAAPKADAKPAAKAEPAKDPGQLTIVSKEVPGFGTIKLPDGSKETSVTDTMAYFSWRSGSKSVTTKVFKNGGRTSLKDAKKWAGLELAKAEVTEASEIKPGVFHVEQTRASDGMNSVVRFDKAGRMSCGGVGVDMEVLKEICGSYPTGG